MPTVMVVPSCPLASGLSLRYGVHLQRRGQITMLSYASSGLPPMSRPVVSQCRESHERQDGIRVVDRTYRATASSSPTAVNTPPV
ncbi:MAG: hypothetical protein JOZ53_04500, partial [Planctomycetaceae bacterium]|nr:hypothetical protein [Planctomycetaceae bacterium]